MCMVQVSLLLIYLLSYTLNPPLALFFLIFLQFNSVLIIIDLVLVLVLGLECQVKTLHICPYYVQNVAFWLQITTDDLN